MTNSGLVAWKMMMFNYIIFLALYFFIYQAQCIWLILKTLEVLSWDPALARQPSVRIKPIDISNHLCISHVQASVFLALGELEPSFFGDFRLWEF